MKLQNMSEGNISEHSKVSPPVNNICPSDVGDLMDSNNVTVANEFPTKSTNEKEWFAFQINNEKLNTSNEYIPSNSDDNCDLKTNVQSTLTNNNTPEIQDFDDFDEFQNYIPLEENNYLSNNNNLTTCNGESHGQESLCDFQPSTKSSENCVSKHENSYGEEEEFADFETAITEDVVGNTFVNYNESLYKEPLTDLNTVFKNTFPYQSDFDLNEDVRISDNLFDKASSNSKLVWSTLQTIEVKSHFCFDKWKESYFFQKLLQALKINVRTMIHPESYPTYAPNMGHILKPISTSDSNNYEIISTSIMKCENNEKIEPKLVNSPQSTFQHTTLNQDLDFFESKYNYKNEGQSIKQDLISELEECENEKSNKNNNSFSKSSSTNDFKELLKNSLANTNNEQVLSAEALQILSELPNLSFIRAKVLMFPIKDNTES